MIRWTLKEFDETDSTQDIASKLGAEGAPEGIVVVAKRQTAGRGRRGRSWTSPKGGLYMSLLLRPSLVERTQTLAMVAALAVAKGIENATPLRTRIRWPNDVTIEGRKVAGVIIESTYYGQALSFATVGIGVNCNSNVQLADPSGNKATSLAEQLGKTVDITILRQSILQEFGKLYTDWLKGADAIAAARNRIGTLERRVTIRTASGKDLEGVAEDIEPGGGLVLNIRGRNLTVQAEDIEWLRET